MDTKTKRAGLTLDAVQFTQGSLPFWPDSFSSSTRTSWIGRLGAERQTVMGIAFKRHTQNESVRLAKAKRQMAILPEPEARARTARAEQRQLDAIHRNVTQIATEVADKRLGLKFFDYEKNGGGVVGALNRQELRAALRAMPEDKRNAAMKSHKFRIAALEQPGALSGLPNSTHAHLIEEELKAKYPQEIQDLDDAATAVELMRETLKPVSLAVENELRAINAPVSEPAVPTEPAPTWA